MTKDAVALFLVAAALPCLAQKRGEEVFLAFCAHCHGPKGTGGRGADLTHVGRATTRDELIRVIVDGIDGTEMPPAPMLSQSEGQQLVDFVLSLRNKPEETAAGNLFLGESLYREKGDCARCHAIDGKGGRMGPDLSGVGLRRSLAYLRRALTEPGAEVPDGYAQVRVNTKDGKHTTGFLLNEDTFSLRLRDFSGHLLSFWKTDVTELRKDPGQSPMPSFRDKFSAKEVEDLVAYLASRRSVQ
jgi:cytochrome c oxidase cbb3-type subunit 3